MGVRSPCEWSTSGGSLKPAKRVGRVIFRIFEIVHYHVFLCVCCARTIPRSAFNTLCSTRCTLGRFTRCTLGRFTISLRPRYSSIRVHPKSYVWPRLYRRLPTISPPPPPILMMVFAHELAFALPIPQRVYVHYFVAQVSLLEWARAGAHVQASSTSFLP